MTANTNFATWNSMHYQGGSGSTTTFSEGNCRVGTTSGGYPVQISNFAFPTSGKWYIELNNIVNNGYHCFGIVRQINVEYGNHLLDGTGAYQYQAWNGQKRGNGASSQSYGSSWGSAGIIIGLAFDADNGKIWWSKNNTWQASGDPAGNSNEAFSGLDANDNYYFGWSDYYTAKAGTVHINCGQDSSFSGSKTSGSANATDGNGYGDFYYTPPTGFLALASANLPTLSDIDPAETSSDYPGKQFNCVTYTGNAGSNSITGLGFKPDFCWIKKRNSTGGAAMVNSTIGGQKVLQSNNTDAEGSSSPFQTFDADGFTLDGTSSYLGNFNGSSDTYVAWCWRANGGTTASNSDGTITTTLQVGKGFSIGTYTGTGSNATVGHGLGAIPDFTIFRERGSSGNWAVTSQKNMSSNDHNLYLQTDQAQSDGNYFQNTAMTSSVISIGTHADINGSSNTYVMYNWINIQGYQRFGKYTGNGNANGPFIYTGFRPRMIFVKLLNSAGDWWIQDTARSTFNPADKYIAWNRTDAEATGIDVDFLSNGFKIRTSSGDFNSNGAEILYGAWGDVPFKYNNTF